MNILNEWMPLSINDRFLGNFSQKTSKKKDKTIIMK